MTSVLGRTGFWLVISNQLTEYMRLCFEKTKKAILHYSYASEKHCNCGGRLIK